MRSSHTLLCVIVGAALGAEEGVFQHLDPRPPSAAGLRGAAEAQAWRRAEGADGGSLAVDREGLRPAWLVLRPGVHEVWVEGRATRTALRGDLRLGDGSAPAGDYLDAAAGATWRRRGEAGGVVGASAAAVWRGRSDVADGLHRGATASIFARLALERPGDGVLLAAVWDSDGSPLLGIPVLPMAAWQGTRAEWTLILGVPVVMASRRGAEWGATATLAPLPGVSGDVRIAGPLRAVAAARFADLTLRPADAGRDADRLHLSQWECSAGLRAAAGPALSAELAVGLATARRVGVGDSLLEARRAGVRLAAGPFIGVRGRWNF